MLNCYHHLHYFQLTQIYFLIYNPRMQNFYLGLMFLIFLKSVKNIELHIGGHTAWKLERKEDSHVLKLIGSDQMVILLVTVVICMQGK